MSDHVSPETAAGDKERVLSLDGGSVADFSAHARAERQRQRDDRRDSHECPHHHKSRADDERAQDAQTPWPNKGWSADDGMDPDELLLDLTTAAPDATALRRTVTLQDHLREIVESTAPLRAVQSAPPLSPAWTGDCPNTTICATRSLSAIEGGSLDDRMELEVNKTKECRTMVGAHVKESLRPPRSFSAPPTRHGALQQHGNDTY